MTIDWSKAPADAEFARTWGVEGGTAGVDFYKKDGYGGLLYLDGHRWDTALTKPNDPDLVPRPTWNGEGLPPVGTVCEYRWAGVCRQVEIIAHWRAPADFVAVYVPLEDGAHSTECGRAIANAFRPIRTPEQIAADKRMQEIEVLEKDFFTIGFGSYRATAESLHRLGYRKTEGGAA
jgi:hypothetical protein